MNRCWKALTRRKQTADGESESKLARVLTLFDLTALGVGSTLGLGVYVLAGSVAYEQAGPAVTLSFLIAAIASAFAGLCYAEFAARVPKAGSAYVYSYVTIGEFVAFTIGWNLILEYVLGTSSVARGMSGYLDAMFDNAMAKALREALPMNISFLADYPDFFSFATILILTVILSVGVKESSVLNNIFTCINLVTVLVVIVAGGMNCDPANWSIKKEDIPEGVRGGEGGFMPYGIAGVMAGAAKCFFGFVGFDCVATTGEEAINPKRNIPLSIVISLIIIFLSYFGVSTVLTMMWPYYLQDPNAPFPHVFNEIGWIEVKWVVTIGAVFALCTSLLGAMFPLPRVLYAMANDGILFRYLKGVHSWTKTPLRATIISGFFAAVMSLIFNLNQLIDMMSIGTLLAYTIVAVCVLVLRYQDDGLKMYEVKLTTPVVLKQLLNLNFTKHPNSLTSAITKIGVVVFSILAILLCTVMKVVTIDTSEPLGIILIVILAAGLLLVLLTIARQPISEMELTFKVPLVPYIPCLSVLINLYLMFQLDEDTWIRFAGWVTVGYLIYFGYGIRHSVAGKNNSKAKAIKIQEIVRTSIEVNGTNTTMPGEQPKKHKFVVNN